MRPSSLNYYTILEEYIGSLPIDAISANRRDLLEILVVYIQNKVVVKETVNINFICTHNSRRSQFAQLLAHLAAYYYHIPSNCYSGGVEETAFDKRAVAALERAGFRINTKGENNHRYELSFAEQLKPLIMYSKLYNDVSHPTSGFAAVMTCSDADENCPVISGSEQRIPIVYDDPKEFDGLVQESIKYDESLKEIATEMFYVFSKVIN